MKSIDHYKMELRPRSELTTGLVLYGENEPAEKQIENLWKIVDRRTGEELSEPQIDFSEFTTGDILYPSMMKPEVKSRWDRKQYEKEEARAAFARLKRMVHAEFMEQNPNLPVVQKLRQTTYGNQILNEFRGHFKGSGSTFKPGAFQPAAPQIGTGKSIRDEMERDNVDINEIADEVLQFLTPKTENTYAVLAVNRDENLRIKDKLLVSEQSSHVLEYQYDEGGRIRLVKYNGGNVEIYGYNQLGQRVSSHVAGGRKLEYMYNNLGQLVRAGDTTYMYDADGDLSEKKSSEGITSYEYLETGQLCGVLLPDGTDIEYRFDERGFRTAKYINGQLVQRYLWKDLTTLAAVEDAGGVSRFYYNEHGRPIGMERNGRVFLFATDQLGSIFNVADPSGNSVQDILYDSFGRRVYNSNPEHEAVLGFGGGLYDSDTGLVHFGYREYDPVIGRFISPDPLGYDGGDVDVYGFCLDDPINFVDRDGLKNRTQAADEGEESESEDQESRSDESSKRKNDSITGMDMRKELQALKKRNDKQESETESEKSESALTQDNNKYIIGGGGSAAIPGFEGSIGLDAAYINKDEAAVYFTYGLKGSSGFGFSADISAGTHNATKASDLEGVSTTASGGIAIPGTPLAVGYSKDVSESSQVDKLTLSIGKKNQYPRPEVSGGRVYSKKMFTIDPSFDELGESAQKAVRLMKKVAPESNSVVDKKLRRQILDRKLKSTTKTITKK